MCLAGILFLNQDTIEYDILETSLEMYLPSSIINMH